MDPLPFWPMQMAAQSYTHIITYQSYIQAPMVDRRLKPGWPNQLKNRFGLVPEVAVQSLVQCESDQGLHHHQQPWSDLPPVIGWDSKRWMPMICWWCCQVDPSGTKRPEKNRDAALHGRCHDVPQCHKKLDKLASHGRGWRAISNIKEKRKLSLSDSQVPQVLEAFRKSVTQKVRSLQIIRMC